MPTCTDSDIFVIYSFHILFVFVPLIVNTDFRQNNLRISVQNKKWHFFLRRIKVKGKSGDIALYEKHISKLRSVTCRMGSHSVTCHSTQVNAPRLNPSQIGWYWIYLPRRDLGGWLHTEMVYLLAGSHPSKY